MNLAEYENTITEIDNSADLTDEEKHTALEMIGDEITGCVWQHHTAARAREISSRAFALSRCYPDGGLKAMDSLAAKGLLRAK